MRRSGRSTPALIVLTDGDLSIIAAGRQISGWTGIRVTRGIERCPNDFEVRTSDQITAAGVLVKPGDDCEVYIGTDLVITGWIDIFNPSINAGGHEIRVAGRGKCQDLVDCAAQWPGGQINGNTVEGIATKLADAYGITVIATGDVGPAIPQFSLILGETTYEIVERIARYRGLLVYEDENGNFVIGPVGADKHASGFVQGQNIQSASFVADNSQRFADYQVVLNNVDTLSDAGDGGNIAGEAKDVGITRPRLWIGTAESGVGAYQTVAQRRADWESARRGGRSQKLSVTCDSWRDSDGKLWTPNFLAPFSVPALHVPDDSWIIAEVSYLLDEQGTRAELVLMPPPAFQPEPYNFPSPYVEIQPQAPAP